MTKVKISRPYRVKQVVPNQDKWTVYRVDETRDGNGNILAEQVVAEPGLLSKDLAQALARLKNRQRGLEGSR